MLFGNRVVKYCILEDEVVCVLIFCPSIALCLAFSFCGGVFFFPLSQKDILYSPLCA